jgi:hypothetical protein
VSNRLGLSIRQDREIVSAEIRYLLALFVRDRGINLNQVDGNSDYILRRRWFSDVRPLRLLSNYRAARESQKDHK